MKAFQFNPKFHYTPSIEEIAETHQCYWLITIVDSYIHVLKSKYKDEYFFSINLKVNENGSATFTISSEHYGQLEDKEKKIIIKQEIPTTTLEHDQTWWLVDNCLMIPSDY